MTETINPLLAPILKLPGRIFQLPSRGILYTNNELSPEVSEGEVHCKSLSAFDEITLKNPDMLFSGKALSQVLKTSIPDILLPNDLYSKDVDAIMIFLRLVTYGPEYELSVNHGCENSVSHSYIVDLEQVLQKIKYLDPTLFETEYKLMLDTGQVVRLQPVKYKHVLELLLDNQEKKTLTVEDLKSNLRKSMLNIIKSVDDIEDKALISEWLNIISAGNVSKIAEQITKTNDWGPQLDHVVICKDCGKEIEIDIPINPISLF
jgi:hypothetical protein